MLIAVSVLLVLALFSFLILFLVYRKTFAVSKKQREGAELYAMPRGFGEMHPEMRKKVEALAALPFERVSITSRDGVRLFARYYHVKDGAPLEIQCHGYRGMALRDFCGGTPLGIQLSHNVLLIDQRAHGESEGNAISFGIRERFDILDWVLYAEERFGAVPILLVGISMGGASVLMAGGEELPASVCGIVADCPYSSPRDIITSVIRMMHLPPALAYPLVATSARLFGGFSLASCTAIDAVGRCRVPVLLLHGEEDRLVPCDMSRAMHAAAPERVTLYTFPGADHGMSFMSDPARYETAIGDFCDACLKEA